MIHAHSKTVEKHCAGLVRIVSITGFVLVFTAMFLLLQQRIGPENVLMHTGLLMAVVSVSAIVGLLNYHLARTAFSGVSIRNARLASSFNLAGWTVFVFAAVWILASFACVKRVTPQNASIFWYPWSQLPGVLIAGLLGGIIVAARAIWSENQTSRRPLIRLIPEISTVCAGVVVGFWHTHAIPASLISAIFWGIVTAAITLRICAPLWIQDDKHWGQENQVP